MKYAPKKDLENLRSCVLDLAKAVKDIAMWQSYYSIKRNPNVFSSKQRKDILELAKGNITYPLLLQLFREYPILEEKE